LQKCNKTALQSPAMNKFQQVLVRMQKLGAPQ